jgi:hypothetical protein
VACDPPARHPNPPLAHGLDDPRHRPGDSVTRGMLRTLAVLSLLTLVAACGNEEPPEPSPSELTGLIVAIDGEGSDISSFTLDNFGDEYEVFIAPEVDYGFDLAHLREHERDRLPVRCRLDERDGRLYALEIVDA